VQILQQILALGITLCACALLDGGFFRRILAFITFYYHIGALGHFPAARPLRRVGSGAGALGFLRLVFAMIIIKD
jgi:hypothetical protein